MLTGEPDEQPRVSVYPPKEALRMARPLPARELLVDEYLTNDEWQRLQEASKRPWPKSEPRPRRLEHRPYRPR